jgi:serine/threonine protein kinase
MKENTKLGYYEIIRQIGAGRMGETYLVQDTKFDRKAAPKFAQGNLPE